jgi:DivIVA domain-containing protein
VVGEGTEPDRPAQGVPADIRDTSFPLSRRGYDRDAVDAYVKRVNTVIEELEASRSPEAAVTHALREVGEKTSSILQQAGRTAEEITHAARESAEADTARAKKEADDLVANARAEAEGILAGSNAEAQGILASSNAEAEKLRAEARAEAAERIKRAKEEVKALEEEADTRLRKLEADTDAVRTERVALLDDIRELAARVEQAAQGADARFSPREVEESAQDPMLHGESTAEADRSGSRG